MHCCILKRSKMSNNQPQVQYSVGLLLISLVINILYPSQPRSGWNVDCIAYMECHFGLSKTRKPFSVTTYSAEIIETHKPFQNSNWYLCVRRASIRSAWDACKIHQELSCRISTYDLMEMVTKVSSDCTKDEHWPHSLRFSLSIRIWD